MKSKKRTTRSKEPASSPKTVNKAATNPLKTEDPYAKREAEKYDNPVPSREYLLEYITKQEKPLSYHGIARGLKIDDEDRLEGLRRRLRAMERDSQLVRNRRGSYVIASKMDVIAGRVIAHPDGFGFVVPEKGGDDVFLAEQHMRNVLHGDKVLIRVTGTDRKGRREGSLVEVVEHVVKELVGRFCQVRRVAFVEPHNRRITHDIIIPPRLRNGAKDGQMVNVRLFEYPNKYLPPIGKVQEILGDDLAPGMDTEIAIRDHDIPNTWSKSIDSLVDKLPTQVSDKVDENREDLRDLPLVTIDGEDSRDFDDAVYCEPKGKGWRLIVAIADVSHYVKVDSPLDVEAQQRGNSVYFPDRVVPMLPEALSNGLCSINPDVNRLCLACELIISHHGTIRRKRFFEGIMKSAARLTYTQVGAALNGDKKAVTAKIMPHIKHLQGLYLLLRKRRERRGAIDFDTVETRIQFDDQQQISEITPYPRNEAHKIIEEMMLAANVAAAEWLSEEDMPTLFRNHGSPKIEKLKDLHDFLKSLGLSLGGKESPTALHYSKLIAKIQDRPDKKMIETVLLRSMNLAVYSPENKGHFGLAYDAYTHFTSPIRRYPDLLVHRAIRHRLRGNTAENYAYNVESLQGLGEKCSSMERRADEATRDVTYSLKCRYMQNKVGGEYTGTITAVTSFGLFVELDDIFVEGLVHVTALNNDYYKHDAVHHCLRGEASGIVYRLSDKITIQVARVNIETRKIDFVLPNTEANSKPKKARKSRKRSKK